MRIIPGMFWKSWLILSFHGLMNCWSRAALSPVPCLSPCLASRSAPLLNISHCRSMPVTQSPHCVFVNRRVRTHKCGRAALASVGTHTCWCTCCETEVCVWVAGWRHLSRLGVGGWRCLDTPERRKSSSSSVRSSASLRLSYTQAVLIFLAVAALPVLCSKPQTLACADPYLPLSTRCCLLIGFSIFADNIWRSHLHMWAACHSRPHS